VLILLEFLLDLSCLSEHSLSICMARVNLDKFLEALNTLLIFLQFKQSNSPEVQSLDTVSVHLLHLISDADDALPLLQLVFAHNKVKE
jgi:hypothetical protein